MVGERCHSPFHVPGQRRLDGTLHCICTKGEYSIMTSEERREARYRRRRARRQARLQARERRYRHTGGSLLLPSHVLLREEVLQRRSLEAEHTKLRASPLFRHGRPQAPSVRRDVEAEEMQSLHSQGTREDQTYRRPAHYRQANPQDRVQQHSDTALHPAHDI